MAASIDPRIDDYISVAAPFARPILRELRDTVHDACPQIEETIKWRMPHFTYKGKILCCMASFQRHCAFSLTHYELVPEPCSGEAMGQFGRIEKLSDLPTRQQLLALLKQAVQLIEAGPAPKTRAVKAPKPTPSMPSDLLDALAPHPEARATFDGFSPSQQREYVDWIEEAKRAETRARRIAQAVEWLREGKTRHWKYQNC